MNKLKFLIFFLVLFSCTDEDEYRLYLNQITEFKEESIILEKESDDALTIIDYQVHNELNGNPLRYKFAYTKSIILKTITDNLIQHIDSIDQSLILKVVENEDFKMKKRIKRRDRININNKLEIFINQIDTLFKDFPFQKSISSSIKQNINLDSIPLTSNRVEIYKNHALLMNLKNKILSAKSDYLNALISMVDAGHPHMFDIEAVVIPETVELKRGETFSADIFLFVGFTSFIRYSIYIEGKKLEQDSNYIYTYQEKANNKLGNVIKAGFMQVINPVTKDTTNYPFKIEYEIIE